MAEVGFDGCGEYLCMDVLRSLSNPSDNSWNGKMNKLKINSRSRLFASFPEYHELRFCAFINVEFCLAVWTFVTPYIIEPKLL